MSTDWNDPASRLALIERVGAERYNELHSAHVAEITLTTINGYPIVPVQTRFGRLFSVTATTKAFRTQSEAEDFARSQPPR
jgi:hypothetical protein